MSLDKRRLPQRRRPAPLGSRRREAVRKALLAAGPLSSLLYVVATDGVAAARWDGYRRTEQMVSELLGWAPPATTSSSISCGSTRCCSSPSGWASGIPCAATVPCAPAAACSPPTGGTSLELSSQEIRRAARVTDRISDLRVMDIVLWMYGTGTATGERQ